MENVPPGECRGHFQCQDVQKLTYPDNSFDVCTCTEVFEHVANDVKGFSEIYRVLTEGGVFVFTVPLRNNTKTVERAVLVNGKVEHLLEPEYHGDHLRGDGMVLCFRNYGTDIVDRVASVAFKDVRIINTTDPTGWNFNRPVVVALKWEIICRDEN